MGITSYVLATGIVCDALLSGALTHFGAYNPKKQDEEPDAIPVFGNPTKRDKQPTKRAASFGPGKAFYGPVKLPNGVTIRLVCLQDNTNRPNNVWKPDGAAAASGEIKNCLDLSHEPIPKSPRTLFMKVVVDNECSIILETAHYSSLAIYSPYSDWNNMTDRAVIFAPKTLKTTDIRFGVAAGTYKPIGTLKVGGKASGSELSILSLKTIRHSDGGYNYEAIVSYPRQYEKMDASLDAWTINGKLLDPVAQDDVSRIDKKGRCTRWFRFSGDANEKPSRLRLSVRPYYWATFKGIHLYPNSRMK